MAALLIIVALIAFCAGCCTQIAWDRYLADDPDAWSIHRHRRAMRRLEEARRWN